MLCLAQTLKHLVTFIRRSFAFDATNHEYLQGRAHAASRPTPITLQMRPQRFRLLGGGALLSLFPFSLCDVFTLLYLVLMTVLLTVLISRDTRVGHASVENSITMAHFCIDI